MALPDREGKFQAYAVRHALRYIGQNKLPALVSDYRLVTELGSEGDWQDISGKQLQLTGFHYLMKLDGQLNASTVEQIRRAYPGWDGRDLAALENTDLSGELVQVTVTMETWNNAVKPKITWLTAADDRGPQGLAIKNEKESRDIASNLGAKLRAHAGAPSKKPVPPAKPAPRPATPAAPRPSPPPKPAAPAPSAPSTPDDALLLAWNTFGKACPENWNAEDAEREFWRIVGEMFPGRDHNTLTIDEWMQVKDQAPGKIVPF